MGIYVRLVGAKEFMQIVGRQKDFWRAGGTRKMEWREDRLSRLEEVLIARQDDILAALADDLGKPAMEAYLAEFHFLLQELRLIRKQMRAWLKKRRVGSPVYFWPCRSWIERHPFGVALIVAPWNYPFQLSLGPLMAAIAAGNVAIVKPSEMAPASEQLIREIIDEVFQGEGAVAVTGGVEVAKALLEQDFDFIFFTGSTEVGRKVAETAGRSLTPCLLELGGKCPCVIDGNVDLEKAARRLVAGKFLNGGQTCFAPDFVLVDKSVEKVFSEKVAEVIREVPWDDEMAVIISQKHFTRLQKLCQGEMEKFGSDDEARRYFAPRLIRKCGRDHPAMQDEIFGPILPIASYGTEADLQDFLMKLASPLAVYCFSRDEDFVGKVAGWCPSGSLCINDTMKQFSQLELPLGGLGESGHGRYRGRMGVEAFSYQKSVTKRYFFGRDFVELMPPYRKLFPWVRKFLK